MNTLKIRESVTDLNIRERYEQEFGPVTGPVSFRVEILESVTVHRMRMGEFPKGSNVTLHNYGRIIGEGAAINAGGGKVHLRKVGNFKGAIRS